MLKTLFIKAFGVDAYVDRVQSLSGLYHGLFRAGAMREAGIRLVPSMIPKGGVVFDIGANIGKFSILAARAVGSQGRVYAFEPVRRSRETMTRVVQIRRLPQIEIIASGVSDHEGIASMTIPRKENGTPLYMLAHLSESDPSGTETLRETIDLLTLDGFCVQKDVERLDFIKCDVEGAEHAVFAGGREALHRFRPTIFCEVDERLQPRAEGSESVFTLLASLGYRGLQADATGDALHGIDGYRDAGDYFFVHSERLGDIAALTAT